MAQVRKEATLEEVIGILDENTLSHFAEVVLHRELVDHPKLLGLMQNAKTKRRGKYTNDGRNWQGFQEGEPVNFSSGEPKRAFFVAVEVAVTQAVRRIAKEIRQFYESDDRENLHLEVLTQRTLDVRISREFASFQPWLVEIAFYGAFVTRPNTIILHPPGPPEAYL